MLDHALHNQLNNFVDVLQCFIAGMPPCGSSLGFQDRAIGVPVVIVRFNDNSEAVSLHVK
jgi:hypothetical protein